MNDDTRKRLNELCTDIAKTLEEFSEALEAAAASISLFQVEICEANGGHLWKDEGPNNIFRHSHLECSICGTISMNPNKGTPQ